MASDYQIEEMVHQDAKGVIFHAKEKSTGREVALRRFFLDEHFAAALSEKDGEGVTIFEQGLSRLKALEVPYLRKVRDGGLDPVDGTPFVVTDWWAGDTFAQGLRQGNLGAGDAPYLDAEARELWNALSEDERGALSFDPNEVIFERQAEGPVFSFWIDPLKFFRQLAEGRHSEHPDDWQGLSGALGVHSPAPAPAPATASRPVVLKSAKSGGMGMIFAATGLLIVACGGAGWWFLMGPGKAAPEVAEVVEKHDEAAKPGSGGTDVEEKDVAENDDAIEADEVTAAEEAIDEEEEAMAEEQVAEAEEEDSSEEDGGEEMEREGISLRSPDADEGVIDDSPPEGDVSADELFGSGDDGPGEKTKETTEGFPIISSRNPQEIESLIGQQIILEGKVVKADKSRDPGKTWYLTFEKSEEGSDTIVSFLHGKSDDPGTYQQWQALLGKTVRVTGKAGKINRGKLFLGVIIGGIDSIEVTGDTRVYQVGDISDLQAMADSSLKITLEAVVVDLKGGEEMNYLILGETDAIQIGFLKDGPLMQNEGFRKGLLKLKGKRVKFAGLLGSSPNGLTLRVSESSDIEVIGE